MRWLYTTAFIKGNLEEVTGTAPFIVEQSAQSVKLPFGCRHFFQYVAKDLHRKQPAGRLFYVTVLQLLQQAFGIRNCPGIGINTRQRAITQLIRSDAAIMPRVLC